MTKKQRRERRRGPSPLAESWLRDSVRTYKGRLDTALNELGWTQKELSERSGINEATISRSSFGLTMWVAIAIARAMGCYVGWLVAGEGDQWQRRPSKAPPPSSDYSESDESIDVSASKREKRSANGVVKRPARAMHKP